MIRDTLLAVGICVGVLNILISVQCFVVWVLRAIRQKNGQK